MHGSTRTEAAGCAATLLPLDFCFCSKAAQGCFVGRLRPRPVLHTALVTNVPLNLGSIPGSLLDYCYSMRRQCFVGKALVAMMSAGHDKAAPARRAVTLSHYAKIEDHGAQQRNDRHACQRG